jgi:hypothetical protein
MVSSHPSTDFFLEGARKASGFSRSPRAIHPFIREARSDMGNVFPARFAGGVLLIAVILGTMGCNKEKPTATVNGTVKYNGKPQTVGYVNFLSATGSALQLQLDSNGGFKSEAPIEAGEYKVYLGAPIPGQFAPGTKAPTQAKFNVSPKFQDPQSSGYTITLKPGANEGVVIEMKD